VTPKLTINLGLRWDINPRAVRTLQPFESRIRSQCRQPHRQVNRPHEIPRSSSRCGQGGAPVCRRQWRGHSCRQHRIGLRSSRRIGFAYQVRPKLVVRGGWGKYYLNPQNDYIQTAGYSYNTRPSIRSTSGRTAVPNLLNNPFPSASPCRPETRLAPSSGLHFLRNVASHRCNP